MTKINLLLILLTLLPAFARAGELADAERLSRAQALPAQNTKIVRPGANPCSEFGPGFVQVEGSSTCIRLGGAVRIEGATSLSR